jgi:hypothetical protein
VDASGHEYEEDPDPSLSWWSRMFVGTSAHQAYFSYAQSAGYENTLTNRTMSTAIGTLGIVGMVSRLTMSREERAIADSRADLIIQDEDGVAHVFELKPAAQLDDPRLHGLAEAQVAGYVATLKANKVDAVAGDPSQFPRLFTGKPEFVGNAVGPGVGHIYSVKVVESGAADGLLGYTLSYTGDTRLGQMDRALGKVLPDVGQSPMTSPLAIPPPWWALP